MPTKQIIAFGGTVERSTNGTTWTAIPEVKGIAVPAVTQDYQDATSLDSTNGFREYVKGLKDAGELTLQAGYTAAGYEQQLADQAAADAIYYRVTMAKQIGQTTGDRFTYRGFPVPSLEAGGVGDLINMNINIRTTGDVTWVKGT